LLVLLLDQGGLGGLAADASTGASLTCKDSLLVGWGGASDQDDICCPILETQHSGSTLKVEGCTLQLHPDSRYSKPAVILRATDHASIRASGCRLVGPTPGNSSTMIVAAMAEAHGTIALVGTPASMLLASSLQPVELAVGQVLVGAEVHEHEQGLVRVGVGEVEVHMQGPHIFEWCSSAITWPHSVASWAHAGRGPRSPWPHCPLCACAGQLLTDAAAVLARKHRGQHQL
jgi:hypothetical protein